MILDIHHIESKIHPIGGIYTLDFLGHQKLKFFNDDRNMF